MLDQLKNIGSHLVAGGASLAHLGLEGTTNTANMVGKGVLLVGGVASAVLAYDTYLWNAARAQDTLNLNALLSKAYGSPIWANIACEKTSAPLMDQVFALGSNSPCSFLNTNELNRIISAQALLAIALPTAIIMGSYACFKVGALINRVNHLF